MALKTKIKKLEDVEEQFRGLYKQDGDGFVLDIEGGLPGPAPENDEAKKAIERAKAAEAEAEKRRKEAESTKAELDKLNGKGKTTEAQLAELREQLEEQKTAAKQAKVDSTFAEAARVLASKVKPKFASLFEETELRKHWEVNDDGQLVHKEGTYKDPAQHLEAWTKDVPEALPSSQGGGVQASEDDTSNILDNYMDDKGKLDYGALEKATEDGKNPHLLEALNELT